MTMKCPESHCNVATGLIQSPGATLNTSTSSLDSATVKYTINKNNAKSKCPGIGDKHPDRKLINLYCQGATIVYEGAYAIITANYVGFKEKNAKIPNGGGTRSTVETNIALHANYKKRPNTWVDKKYIFGDGPSPNAFGRITETSAGAFLYFGPLPDGKNKRPEPACNCPSENKYERGICHLQGVESFIEQGAVTYRYSVQTTRNWIENKIKKNLGKICKPRSKLVPVPDLQEEANWLFTNITVESTPLATGNNGQCYATTAEFLSSGPGGWNTYIYEKGDDLNLDSLIGSTPF